MPNSNSKSIVRVSGKLFVTFTHASNITSVALTPVAASGYIGNFGTRLTAIADAFEFFRFTSICVEIPPNRSSSAGEAIMGYVSQYSGTAPTTFAQITEFECSSRIIPIGISATFSATTETQMWHIPKKYLNGGALKWYRTTITSFPTDFEQQGTIWSYHPVATGQTVCNIWYTIELKNPINTGLTVDRPLKGPESKEEDRNPPTEDPVPEPVFIVQPPPGEQWEKVSNASAVSAPALVRRVPPDKR